jgi:hypothetical protein
MDTNTNSTGAKKDWKDPSTKHLTDVGSKGMQRTDKEDREIAFREWHMSLGRQYTSINVDDLEYRIVGDGDDDIIFKAVLEITRVDHDDVINDNYLQAILDRYETRDAQGRVIRRVAKLLGVKVWIVLWRYSLQEFCLYNLTDRRGWFKNISKPVCAKWIKDGCPDTYKHP